MTLHYKRAIFLIIMVVTAATASGQQIPAFSQYIMNGYLVNPSLAGRDGFTTVNFTAREQWIGMPGAPSTYVASFQSTWLRNSYMSRGHSVRRKVSRPSKPSRVGYGASLFTDNNGIIRRSGLKFDYAYHIPIGKRLDGQSDLSMGLGLVTYQFALRTDELRHTYQDDPYLSTFDKSLFITDFSFGASFTAPKYYVGFSMTNIARGSLVFGNNSDNKFGELGHFFLTGGMNIPINREWSIKPSAFIKSSDMLLKVMQMDLTSRVFFKDNYWGGLSYRTRDAVILLMGFHYDKFYFANAFDLTMTDMRNRSHGSIEFSIAMKFGESSRRYRWLNAF